MAYFNQSDVTDMIAQLMDAVESEPDRERRQAMALSCINAINTRLSDSLARLCYDGKKVGVPTWQIANDLGISQRAVLRLTRKYAADNGLKNVLDPIEIEGSIDIRDQIDL